MIASLSALIIVSPILLIEALIIFITLGRPILFRQVRAGKDELPFRLLKFRTMRDDRDESGSLRSDESRLTSIGRFLRSWSLDELPQLWNVLRGELSLVGPRPLPMRYLPRYTAEQKIRHKVSPGMTGLAQVNGRNDLSWESRLKLDAQYVREFSIWLDLRILLATVRTVCLRIGARDRGTSSEFWGTSRKPPGSPDSYPFDEDEFV